MHDSLSPFLELPCELRLRIYESLLPQAEYSVGLEMKDCPVRWTQGLCPSILFVNRKIHTEAAELLYSNNVFALYCSHPNEARLPMNESRPDTESFLLFSWVGRHWAHPRNARMPLSVLRNHGNLRHIHSVYVSIPAMDGLIGVDAYFRRSSRARFYGMQACKMLCLERGGRPAEDELDRMRYVSIYKRPVDDLGFLLQSLSRVEFLSVAIQRDRYTISFLEFMLSQILSAPKVDTVKCYYIPKCTRMEDEGQLDGFEGLNEIDPMLGRFRSLIKGSFAAQKTSEDASKDAMAEMLLLLETIRARQSLQKSHSSLDPLDVIHD